MEIVYFQRHRFSSILPQTANCLLIDNWFTPVRLKIMAISLPTSFIRCKCLGYHPASKMYLTFWYAVAGSGMAFVLVSRLRLDCQMSLGIIKGNLELRWPDTIRILADMWIISGHAAWHSESFLRDSCQRSMLENSPWKINISIQKDAAVDRLLCHSSARNCC